MCPFPEIGIIASAFWLTSNPRAKKYLSKLVNLRKYSLRKQSRNKIFKKNEALKEWQDRNKNCEKDLKMDWTSSVLRCSMSGGSSKIGHGFRIKCFGNLI